MDDALVLATSACFAILEDESGRLEATQYLAEAIEGARIIHASFVTLTEVEYSVTQKRGADEAQQALR